MTKPVEMSECCTCGYQWITGTHGGHSCATKLLEVNESLRQQLEAAQKLISDDQYAYSRKTNDLIAHHAAQIDCLKQQLAQCEADARRWNKLWRMPSSPFGSRVLVVKHDNSFHEYEELSKVAAEKILDAAIAAEGVGEEG